MLGYWKSETIEKRGNDERMEKWIWKENRRKGSLLF